MVILLLGLMERSSLGDMVMLSSGEFVDVVTWLLRHLVAWNNLRVFSLSMMTFFIIGVTIQFK